MASASAAKRARKPPANYWEAGGAGSPAKPDPDASPDVRRARLEEMFPEVPESPQAQEQARKLKRRRTAEPDERDQHPNGARAPSRGHARQNSGSPEDPLLESPAARTKTPSRTPGPERVREGRVEETPTRRLAPEDEDADEMDELIDYSGRGGMVSAETEVELDDTFDEDRQRSTTPAVNGRRQSAAPQAATIVVENAKSHPRVTKPKRVEPSAEHRGRTASLEPPTATPEPEVEPFDSYLLSVANLLGNRERIHETLVVSLRGQVADAQKRAREWERRAREALSGLELAVKKTNLLENELEGVKEELRKERKKAEEEKGRMMDRIRRAVEGQ